MIMAEELLMEASGEHEPYPPPPPPNYFGLVMHYTLDIVMGHPLTTIFIKATSTYSC